MLNEKIVSLVPLTEEEKCHIGKQYGLEYYPEIIVPPIPVTIPQNNNKKVVVLVSVLIASVCAVIGLVVYLVSGKNTSEYVNNDVVSAQLSIVL